MTIKGSCLCGSVTYESPSAPVMSGNCHCRDCQKATGSAYAPTLFFPENKLTIQGEVKFFESLGGSGKKAMRGFCPQCGSQLFGKLEAMPGLISVRAGSLDDTSLYHPQADVYVSQAAAWDFIPPSANAYSEMPPR